MFRDGRKRKTGKSLFGCFGIFHVSFQCLGVSFRYFRCFAVLLFGCFAVSLFRCFGVSLFRCFVSVFRFGVSWFSDVPLYHFRMEWN